jgi:glutamate racemase
MLDPALPIGVFDSGVGGLTVLRALRRRLPQEAMIYLGDTARLPYGTKSGATVERYALQAAAHLAARGIKLLVIACNTASAEALPALRRQHPRLPIIGVIEPGAAAAVAASSSGRIAVIATEATVRAAAYERAIAKLRPEAAVRAQACSLLVALAEEGWVDDAIAEAVLRRYLAPLFAGADRPDCLVLGCTHFPLLKEAIGRVLGPDIALIDSGVAAAEAVAATLDAHGLAAPAAAAPELRLLATDGAERFAQLAARFLGMPLAPAAVELVEFGAGREGALSARATAAL